MARAYIYGDSLLKATMPDEQFHYHFHLPEVMERYSGRQTEVVNRSKMGATIRKGQALLEHDLQRGMQADYALIAYGGNDSDFDWDAVQDSPRESHLPRTTLADFKQILLQMLRQLKDKGVQPVLMTLPPIDAQRYLDFLCRDNLRRDRILDWLGEPQMIYRHQELYADTAAEIALRENIPLIPVRQTFLRNHRLSQLIAADGIHLTVPGYEQLFDTLADGGPHFRPVHHLHQLGLVALHDFIDVKMIVKISVRHRGLQQRVSVNINLIRHGYDLHPSFFLI